LGYTLAYLEKRRRSRMIEMKNKAKSNRHTDELQKYKRIVKTIPEVRKGKVEEIKRQIKAGKYKVLAESVASSMADLHHELMLDKRGENGMTDE